MLFCHVGQWTISIFILFLICLCAPCYLCQLTGNTGTHYKTETGETPTFVELASPASTPNVFLQGLMVLVVIVVTIVALVVAPFVTIMVALVAPFLGMMRIGDGLGRLQRAS